MALPLSVSMMNKLMRRKWSAFKLSSEEFSCQRVQSQTCLSYAECSRKSHVCKMYEILNKQVRFLASQYIGTCKSAYTKGLCPKLSTNAIYNI